METSRLFFLHNNVGGVFSGDGANGIESEFGEINSGK